MTDLIDKISSIRTALTPWALAFLRVAVGIIMTVHGWQKLQDVEKFINGLDQMGFFYPQICAYLAISGEFLGGLGLVVGVLTPLAAFGIFSTMCVAVFVVHWEKGLLAQNGGFEYPLCLLVVSFFLMMNGAGKISLDYLFNRNRV